MHSGRRLYYSLKHLMEIRDVNSESTFEMFGSILRIQNDILEFELALLHSALINLVPGLLFGFTFPYNTVALTARKVHRENSFEQY